MSGYWWALLTACVWGLVPLLEKAGLRQTDPTTGVLARSAGVMIGVVLVGVTMSPWRALGNLNLRSFALLALGGFLASFVGQMMFYRALKTSHISYVTPIAGAYPLVAVLLGWWVLREPLSPARLCGAALIIAGVWLLGR